MYSLQIIKKSIDENKSENVIFSKIDSPRSLDDFDINILSLTDKKIWERKGSKRIINDVDDIKTIGEMLIHSNSFVIIELPQNIDFKYDYNPYNNNYRLSYRIKNNINLLYDVLEKLNFELKFLIRFETTETKIMDRNIYADFCFETDYFEIKTKSLKSKRATTIMYNNIIITTLNLSENNLYEDFIKEIEIISEKSDAPDWFNNFKFFDDEEQSNLVENERRNISISKEKICNATKKIESNNHYKSIIYSNSDELVNVCCEIIDEMTGLKTASFEDNHKEDFSVKVGKYILIAEIKGVTHNVKNYMLSQLETHREIYIDEHDIENENMIKSVLIVNHQRDKELKGRQNIAKQQINKAEKKDILIIETITLLKLYGKFIDGKISKDDVIDLFTSNKGLLKID